MSYSDEGQSVVGEKREETTYETHRAEADVLFKQGDYRKAEHCFTQALEKIDENRNREDGGCGKLDAKEEEKYQEKVKKDERRILVSRSKCHLMLGNAQLALVDAESSLVDDKHFIGGLFQKAEALYYRGEFEPALVHYHRGNKLRPEFQDFRLGIQKAQEAINNCIGTPESVKLENKGDLSEFYKHEEKNKKKVYGNKSKQDDRKKVKKERPKSVGKNSKTIKELLGDLYQDREYLDNLWREEDAMEVKTASSHKIQKLCLEAIKYLDSRTEFWRQQKPMYARKRDRMLQQKQWNKGRNKGKQDMKDILQSIEEIDDHQANGDYDKSLKKSKRTAKTIDSLDENECSNKMELLANVYSYMGNSHLELGKYDLALQYHQKDLDIANDKNLEDCRSRALDNLGRVYARMGQFQRAADVWEEKLPLSKSSLESTWLYHEVGRCYLELGDFVRAHEYGQKSMAAAEEACDGVWQLNASVLIAQSEVKMEKYEDAAESFQKSLEMARHLDDEPVENAIKKALEEVDRKLLELHRKEDVDEDKHSVKSHQSDRSHRSGEQTSDDPTLIEIVTEAVVDIAGF